MELSAINSPRPGSPTRKGHVNGFSEGRDAPDNDATHIFITCMAVQPHTRHPPMAAAGRGSDHKPESTT